MGIVAGGIEESSPPPPPPPGLPLYVALFVLKIVIAGENLQLKVLINSPAYGAVYCSVQGGFDFSM